MTDAPIRIWLEISHHTAFRVGGWAFVRADGAAVSGTAGGDRRIDVEGLALAALAAALKGVAAGRPVVLQTGSPAVAAIPLRLREAVAGENVPTENLALWAQAKTALAAGAVVARGEPKAGTPGAFAASWAELAREKAKVGPFSAAIPKTNLAKAGV